MDEMNLQSPSQIAAQVEREYMKKAVKALFMFAGDDVTAIRKAIWDYERELLRRFEEERPELCKGYDDEPLPPLISYTGFEDGLAELLEIKDGNLIVEAENNILKLSQSEGYMWQPLEVAKLIQNLTR